MIVTAYFIVGFISGAAKGLGAPDFALEFLRIFGSISYTVCAALNIGLFIAVKILSGKKTIENLRYCIFGALCIITFVVFYAVAASM